MVPAHQRFHPDNPSGGKLDLRLVVKLQLAASKSCAQIFGEGHALLDLAVEVGLWKRKQLRPSCLAR